MVAMDIFSNSLNNDATMLEEDTDDDPLLTHAKKVYSAKGFSIFKHEYNKSLALLPGFDDEDSDDEGCLVFKYKVEKFDHYLRHHRVIALTRNEEVNCSCNYFNVTGILCSHALAILQCLHFEEIPKHYLLNFWMKSEVRCLGNEPRKQARLSSDDCLYSKSIITSFVEEDRFENQDYIDDAHVSAPLLKHAKEIYLPNVARTFNREYRKSEYLMISFLSKVIDGEQIIVECEVRNPRCSKTRIVRAKARNGIVNCSCKMFERTGILCSHALAVLTCLCIVRIPPRYVRAQFLKDAAIAETNDIHGPLYSKLVKYFHVRELLKRSDNLRYKPGRNEYDRYLLDQYSQEISAKFREIYEDDLDGCGESDIPAEKLNGKKAIRFYDDHSLKNFVYREFKQRSDPPPSRFRISYPDKLCDTSEIRPYMYYR